MNHECKQYSLFSFVLLQVLCTLRCYATGSSQRVIGGSINISPMSVCRSVHAVSAVLVGNANTDIYFPRSARQINATKADFYNLAGFPKVLGAIDGSLVPILAPSDNERVYVSRK